MVYNPAVALILTAQPFQEFPMKTFALATAALLLSTSAAFAVKTYQVTGPVLELTDSKITVQKGKGTWEIARTADSKIPASVKVGSKVTIQYSMTAAEVTDKSLPATADKAEKTDAKKK
jgi:hypothetical protein